MNDSLKRRHRHMAEHPSPAQGALRHLRRSLGAPKAQEEVPAREPSWEYIRYLERRQKETGQQVILWFGIAVFSLLALTAVSTLWTWPL